MKEEATIINLPKHPDRRGNLSVVEEDENVPFRIARTYWIYDVPGGEKRGGHAYRRNRELIVALSGSFEVMTDDGRGGRRTFRLSRSYYGLYVPAGTWRELSDFSTNAVALVIASEPYDADDYIRSIKQFKDYAGEQDSNRS
ncbi:MAG: FdtA/QdtA family cupin domain-containing protein [Muribaculaceae bacterium]|nr:FdtA/QdtA family cupin domain-containing protein [Muribaculaceae bacterium]